MGEAVFDAMLTVNIPEGDILDGRIHFLFLSKAKTRRLNCHLIALINKKYMNINI